MGSTIVELTPSSRPDAVALWREAGLTRPWNDPDADFDRALAGPASAVPGALQDGRLVGTVMVGHDGHRGWVYYLATASEVRGRGYGRALMLAAEEWIARRGIVKIQFMVRADNDAVCAFYEHLGYSDQNCRVLGRRLDG